MIIKSSKLTEKLYLLSFTKIKFLSSSHKFTVSVGSALI